MWKMRKLLQRRMRIAWGWFFTASFFSAIALESYTRGQIVELGRRHLNVPIRESTDPDGFYFFLGTYAVIAAIGWIFSFYQFRRGSWFNPI
jgi:hypothetical protein